MRRVAALMVIRNGSTSDALGYTTLTNLEGAEMTIVEAAAAVLREAGRSMTPGEIFKLIEEGKSYAFKAKHPEQVLSQQLRRHSQGVDNAVSSKDKWFAAHPGGRYSLLAERRGR
jgi:hypothetical protein